MFAAPPSPVQVRNSVRFSAQVDKASSGEPVLGRGALSLGQRLGRGGVEIWGHLGARQEHPHTLADHGMNITGTAP
jgi:hypothetical protein